MNKLLVIAFLALAATVGCATSAPGQVRTNGETLTQKALDEETAEEVDAPGRVTTAKDAEYWFEKGYELAQANQPKKALECFDRALSLNPRHDLAWSTRPQC